MYRMSAGATPALILFALCINQIQQLRITAQIDRHRCRGSRPDSTNPAPHPSPDPTPASISPSPSPNPAATSIRSHQTSSQDSAPAIPTHIDTPEHTPHNSHFCRHTDAIRSFHAKNRAPPSDPRSRQSPSPPSRQPPPPPLPRSPFPMARPPSQSPPQPPRGSAAAPTPVPTGCAPARPLSGSRFASCFACSTSSLPFLSAMTRLQKIRFVHPAASTAVTAHTAPLSNDSAATYDLFGNESHYPETRSQKLAAPAPIPSPKRKKPPKLFSSGGPLVRAGGVEPPHLAILEPEI